MSLRGATASTLLGLAALLLCVPASAATSAKKPPPTDHGFPLDEYLEGLIAGKVFVGGAPPKIVGAKTKDAVFVVDGKAHYQPQIALRRAGRDDGTGRFLILRARSWGSALAYVIKLDPGIVKLFRIAFPKAIGGKPFPPLYAGIKYTFEVAADSPAPKFEQVPVASTPHPDPSLRKNGVTLVTLKRGLTPGTYLVHVVADVELNPHPLKTLYDAYEQVTGAVEWLTIALAPGEVALEKLVDKAIEKLVERAAAGDPKAAVALSKQALRERVAKKALENAVKTALTKTEAVAKIEVPTVVPDLRGLRPSEALKKLQERFLRYTWLQAPTTNAALANTVKSQSEKPGTKVKVGTRVRVRVWRAAAAQPKPTTPSQPGQWTLVATEVNPDRGASPANSQIAARSGHLDWTVTDAPMADFDVDYRPPPTRLAPGGTHSFAVTVAGRLTGGTNTQGFRTVTAILLVGDRWDGRTAVAAGVNCYDPVGSAPISCTPPASSRGTFVVSVPRPARSGDTFTFGVGALNCGSVCYVRYTYRAP